MKDTVKMILEETKRGLKPPIEEEITLAQARWLFGRNAPKMLAHAPWSFVLAKLLWKKGEGPWES
ncbi:MAG: hypothetical protein A2Y69_15625 [Candidatus Aminicenantes bacterium RBG_13_59_9]|jgi:hypothetical protein|nr:MAG: hypothetical protein A2Y69_15625 [Candidatus Aminicenantes bacterium RBG_13_59_9]